VPRIQPPAAPSSLAASGTTTSTTNLSWSASSDNVAVTGYNVYQDKATVASTSYVVTGLTANNAYILCKSKDAAGNISATSNAISVTTLNNTLVYCTSKGNSVADEYIDYVSIEVSITLPPVMLDMVTLLILWVIFLMVQTQSYLVLVLAVPLTLNIGKSGLTIIKMELLKLLKK
jgi:hypothetical protein